MQPLRNKNFLKRSKNRELLIVFLLCGVGIILRTILFGKIPPGLNQDEAAAGYEAYSLLLTGKDKWGNIWPVYFAAWGPGQNVLYSYLLIPIVYFFGLSVASIRSINLIFGILTIPLLYIFTKETVSRKVAYISTLILAINPWHIMLSRWGLESNLLPFWLLLGFYSVHRALKSTSSFIEKIACLIPWAVALYAYATFYFIIPILFILLFKEYKNRFLESKRAWIIAFSAFTVISGPIILFVLKNTIFHSRLIFEKFLPFSIPLLTGIPLRGINPQTNLEFILNGFQDNNIWNMIPGVPSFYMISFPFLCVGIYILYQKRIYINGPQILLLWLFSCIPLFFVSSLNINRSNSIFIPSLLISIIGFNTLLKKIGDIHYRFFLRRVITAWVLFSSFLFATNYFFFYSEKAYDSFNYGLDSALDEAKAQSKASEKILVTNQIRLPYIYILFLDHYSPSEFQKNSRYSLDREGNFDVFSFGKYYFSKDRLRLRPIESFVFIRKLNEETFCKNQTVFYIQKNWKVGRCFGSMSSDRK